jgi:hypothetical protein
MATTSKYLFRVEGNPRKGYCAFSSDVSVLALGKDLRQLKANALEALNESEEYQGIPLSDATALAFTFRKA